MKNTWYKAEIIKRFMNKKEQAEFDRKYTNSRIINVGRKAIYKADEYWEAQLKNE